MSEYTTSFYDLSRAGAIRSADVIVPVVYDLIKPKSVIDIGCGEGHWAHRFQEFGCKVMGVDGDYVANSPLGENFVARDISVPFTLPITADLVVCLEVAEHLSEERATPFVSDLVKLAPTILFSAAVLNQPGVHHVNCQKLSYWQRLFANHGYQMSGKIRDQFWDDGRIDTWYRCNLTLVTKNPDLYPDYFPDDTELDRVKRWWE